MSTKSHKWAANIVILLHSTKFFSHSPSKLHICLQLNIIKYTFNMEITDISIELSKESPNPLLNATKAAPKDGFDIELLIVGD